jgi:hypothetical protein
MGQKIDFQGIAPLAVDEGAYSRFFSCVHRLLRCSLFTIFAKVFQALCR